MKRCIFALCVFSALLQFAKAGKNCSTIAFPFYCQDGGCTKRADFCNNVAHCNDTSDEIPYNSSIHTEDDGIECVSSWNKANATCLLPKQHLCDHDVDCIGGFDECNCSSTFQCDNGDCGLKIQFCDDAEDCRDGSDETEYNGTGFQCMVTKKHEIKKCKLPDVHVCDGSSECSGGTDECFCGPNGEVLNETYSNDDCFRCLDGSLVIPNTHVCDGRIAHCKDLSDECLCEHKSHANVTELCNNVCIGRDCKCPGKLECMSRINSTDSICVSPEKICDDKIDCFNGLDEKYCVADDELFTCKDQVKRIKKKFICDGEKQCDDGSDEVRCHEDKFICHKLYAWVHKDMNITNWTDPEIAPRLNRTHPGIQKWFRHLWPYYAEPCDGVPLCTDMEDECNNTLCGDREDPAYCEFVNRMGEMKCPNSGSFITGYEVCDGVPTCNDTDYQSTDEKGCPGRFYCNITERLPIHIPEESRCDGKQDCGDVSDEMGCSNDTHYYCNDEGTPLFIPVEQKCDKRKDCAQGRDECEQCEVSPFSSDEKLIQSRVLIGFLWVIGIIATVGNFLIIIHQMVNICKMKRDANPVAVRNRIMVLNLAIADLLTGIYLIALGIKDALTEEYCLADQDWRSSSTCSALGTIAVIGTEASVMVLLIMTAYRLYLVHQPYEGQRLSTILFSLLIAWIIAIVLGTAPLSTMASNYFLSCVWFKTHRYLGYTCRANITEFTMKLFMFEGEDKRFSRAAGIDGSGSIPSDLTWDSMLAAQKALNSGYVPEKYFGYYSAHSVCLPRLFPDKEDDRSWSYSLFLVLLNFFAFVFILVSYICIYRRTTTNKLTTTASSADRAAALQRKVTRIVLSDFCCWMPICIMAFITVAGIDIGPTAYAVTAIILLPINSAMNPFLYSSLLDIVWDHLEPIRNCIGQTPCGKKYIEHRELTRSTRQATMATATTNVASISDSNFDNHVDEKYDGNVCYNAAAADVDTKL